MAITRLQIERAYQLGKQVHAGGIDRQAAIADLHSNHGMDDASAQMYIEALVRMLDGETYKRSINMEATRYYLERIYNDLGSGALEKALISAEGHVDYYDSLGGARKVENRAIVEEFKKLLETPMFTAGSFNTYIKNLETNFFVQAEKGRYIEFWSGKSRSGSMFVIGYDHIARAFQKILDTFVTDTSYATYHEKRWRDLHSQFEGNPVFQSLLLTQTANTFNLLSKLIHWANDMPAASYADSRMPLEAEKLEKTLVALEALHSEGHSGKTGNVTAAAAPPAGHGINLVVYGAPGSGKSHYIDEMTQGKTVFRTVFHPEYQNSDFIGGLRPVKDGDSISYSFIPGPFTNALLHADQNPGTDVYLIIEELNRANAAAVFGEAFQLLDRNDGASQYAVTPDETWKAYLEGKYTTPDAVRIPANLHILATMNSSDQGVFQLDTAFKRRWQFHYCRIDFDAHAAQPAFTDAIIPYQGNSYSWTEFAKALNETLKSRGVEEDRLIGPFFLSNAERKDTATCEKAVTGKLLIYIWDDVLRHSRDGFFRKDIKTFSDLVKAYENGEAVFHTSVEDRLPAIQAKATEAA